MANNDQLVQGIFNELMLVPTKGEVTPLHVASVQAVAKILADLPDAKSILEDMKMLNEDPEQYLKLVRATGNDFLIQYAKDGVNMLKAGREAEQKRMQ